MCNYWHACCRCLYVGVRTRAGAFSRSLSVAFKPPLVNAAANTNGNAGFLKRVAIKLCAVPDLVSHWLNTNVDALSIAIMKRRGGSPLTLNISLIQFMENNAAKVY